MMIEKSIVLRAETLLNLSSIMIMFPHFAIVTHLNIDISYLRISLARDDLIEL